MKRAPIAALLVFVSTSAGAFATSPVPASTVPIPASFESSGDDRRAIESLLSTYTRAVSTKDQALFETLLLNEDIPFYAASSAIRAAGVVEGIRQYERFRKAVFEGAPFQQRFQDVHIQQDGALAEVSLVYVNSTARGSTWGWKTMLLLKVGAQWKIASELFTGHG